MKQQPLLMVKAKRRIKELLKLLAEWARAPLLSKDSLLTLLMTGVATYGMLSAVAFTKWLPILENGVDISYAFIYAYPIYLALGIPHSIFGAFISEHKQGVWSGTRFIYHEPRLIATLGLEATDCGGAQTVKVDVAEIGGSVE